MSALEAMGIGLPVIVTEQCNLPIVAEKRAGWQIQSNKSQLTSALRELFENAPPRNREIGGRGRSLILEHYNWTTVAGQMSEVYRWLLGGPRPQSVEVITAKSL